MLALQVKTSYSLLSSLCKIEDLVKKAKEYGYTSLAITDENNLYGVMPFYETCLKYNIKPIIGVELSLENKKILLYARNNKGYKNIIKLVSLKSEKNINNEDLITHKEGTILVMPSYYYDEKIYNIYDEKYIGFTNIKDSLNEKRKTIYINNVAYLNKEDYKYLDYLTMIKEGKTLGTMPLGTGIGRHLQTKEELVAYVGEEILENMENLTSNCNVQITKEENILPIYNEEIDAYEYLTKLCHKGLNRRLNNTVPDTYLTRLNYELDVINKMGFCDYFLIVYDYVKYAKQNKILVGPGRGSAAGSLASYTLGITDIDPIKYNLLFERFLNPERITMPDIDIDFDAERRNEVIDYITQKYGAKKVASIITFGSLGAKQVIRDVGRVLNIKISILDAISRNLSDTLSASYQTNDTLRKLINSDTTLKKLWDISLHLEGLPRHTSLHAAGIIISRKNLDECIPLTKTPTGNYVATYTMNHLEQLGLLKMDLLALSNLTTINKLINEIREKEHLNITFNNIPLTDQKTIEIFTNVETDGIFQFETTGMKNFLTELKVKNFEDIVLAIALFRPGPMDSINNFIKVREGKIKINYIDEALQPILSSTYGVIIYQEQIMQIARVMGGYTLAEADILRRAMSKKKEDILIKEKPRFINRLQSRGYKEEVAIKIYDLILKFAGYGFNRSHSVAYAIVAYKMAFLKTYFYKYFMANTLSTCLSSSIKTNTYICEIRGKNIKIQLPNINKSTTTYTVVEEGILPPLNIVRELGPLLVAEIIKERETKPFTTFIDFVIRMNNKGITKKHLIKLINGGCFTDYNRQTLQKNLDKVITYAELISTSTAILPPPPEITIYEEYTKEELLSLEINTFGFYLTESPVSKYKGPSDINTKELKNHYNQKIHIILVIDNIKEAITKNNDIMSFITGSDEYGSITVTLFPDLYKKFQKLSKRDIIRVFGRVERRFDRYQVVAKEVRILGQNEKK